MQRFTIFSGYLLHQRSCNYGECWMSICNMYPIDCHTGLAISLLMLVDMITGLRLTWDFLSVFFFALWVGHSKNGVSVHVTYSCKPWYALNDRSTTKWTVPPLAWCLCGFYSGTVLMNLRSNGKHPIKACISTRVLRCHLTSDQNHRGKNNPIDVLLTVRMTAESCDTCRMRHTYKLCLLSRYHWNWHGRFVVVAVPLSSEPSTAILHHWRWSASRWSELRRIHQDWWQCLKRR